MVRLLAVLIDCVYVVAGLLYLPTVLYRLGFAGRYRHGWGWRLGLVPKRYTDRPCVWLHAVSVGEVNAVRTVIERLRQQLPFHEVFVSTTTDTGYDRAVGLFGRDRVFFFPFDFSPLMSLAFRRLRPSIVVLAELEVWPNLLAAANRRSVPVVIINGRVTQRGLRRYRLAGSLCRWLFGQLAMTLVQDDTYRRRFIELGVPAERLLVTGSLKWDTARIDEPGLQEAVAAGSQAVGLDRAKPIVVAGSTAETIEEEAIIRAYQQVRVHYPDLQLVIAPRKPERFDQVARLIRSRGFKLIRRSEHPDGTSVGLSGELADSFVVLLDTMGELRGFYSMATVAIVGRTFVDLGGSDVMEIAALGKAMVMGPSTYNFSEAVAKLVDKEAAIQLPSSAKLASSIETLLADASARDQLGMRARSLVKSQQGATSRTVAELCRLLGCEYDQTHRGIALPCLSAPAKED